MDWGPKKGGVMANWLILDYSSKEVRYFVRAFLLTLGVCIGILVCVFVWLPLYSSEVIYTAADMEYEIAAYERDARFRKAATFGEVQELFPPEEESATRWCVAPWNKQMKVPCQFVE